MRSLRWRLGPVTGDRVDRLSEGAVAAYAAWLDLTAAYIDAQLTSMLARISAGEDPDMVRAHARLAFAVLTDPNGVDR